MSVVRTVVVVAVVVARGVQRCEALRFIGKRLSTDWEAVASTGGEREVGVGELASEDEEV